MQYKETLVREIARRVWDVEPCNISMIRDKGIVNDVFVVTLDAAQGVVRVSPNNNMDQFRKEAWAMASVRDVGIPVPEVVKLGTHAGRVFMAMEYVDGVDATEPSVDAIAVWRRLGAYARRIHTIPTAGFGDDMTAPGRFGGAWTDYLDYNIQSLNRSDHLLLSGVITADQSRLLRERFASLERMPFVFGLCHGDLSLKNVIVDRTGAVTLLDWGSAESHIVPYFDMIEVLQSSFALDHTNAGFLAFAEGLGVRAEQLPTVHTLLLLRAVDKVRWAIDRKPGSTQLLATELRRAMACCLPQSGKAITPGLANDELGSYR